MEKDYLPVKGLPALREAVAEFHRAKDRVEAHPDRVIVGPGSKELMFLLQLVFYGEILVATPCWVSYQPQARIIGRNVKLVPTDFDRQWKITPQQLHQTIETTRDDYRPRLVVLNYPANPSGMTYSADELQEIAEVARRYQCLVLSDEIYGQLHHTGEHVSIGRFYPEGTIISSGLSKWCGAGGWRLGTFVVPPDLEWLLEAMAAVASETYTSVSTPIQHAAVRAFRGGVIMERYLWHVRRILSTLGRECVHLLAQAGIKLHPPTGGFYLFPDFSPFAEALSKRGINDSKTLCDRLLAETGVAILPGSAFARPPQELTARLSYTDFDGARALAASENIPLDQELTEDFTKQWCGHVLEGVRQITAWIGGLAGQEPPRPRASSREVAAARD